MTTPNELIAFIEDIERRYFRTHQDVGASWNARFIWNRVREFAGLPRLTYEDLKERAINDYRQRPSFTREMEQEIRAKKEF